jgi:hypothetical protein
MALIRKLFWVSLFILSTMGFVVLFDHGTVDYVKNFKADFNQLVTLVKSQIPHKKDEGDKNGN